jgi:hypothetical protein
VCAPQHSAPRCSPAVVLQRRGAAGLVCTARCGTTAGRTMRASVTAVLHLLPASRRMPCPYMLPRLTLGVRVVWACKGESACTHTPASHTTMLNVFVGQCNEWCVCARDACYGVALLFGHATAQWATSSSPQHAPFPSWVQTRTAGSDPDVGVVSL